MLDDFLPRMAKQSAANNSKDAMYSAKILVMSILRNFDEFVASASREALLMLPTKNERRVP